MRTQAKRAWTWLRMVLVFGLAVVLPLLTTQGCAGANPSPTVQAALAVPGAAGFDMAAVAPLSCEQVATYGPTGPVPTITEKPFWIVMGLVMLGWIVLAADFPDNK